MHDTAPAHRLPQRHNEHGDVEANEQGAHSNARRHSTTQKTVRRRKGTSSPEDQDSQFRCARMARTTQFTHTVPLPISREVFLLGNLLAKPLRARPPSFEERLPVRNMTTDNYDGGHGGCLHERRLFERNNWFHEIGRCQRICVWFSNAPPWQEQMTEKKFLVERYVLQTNTNTDGRVDSCDTGQ